MTLSILSTSGGATVYRLLDYQVTLSILSTSGGATVYRLLDYQVIFSILSTSGGATVQRLLDNQVTLSILWCGDCLSEDTRIRECWTIEVSEYRGSTV